MSLIILKVSTISERSLRYSSDGIPSDFSLSGYDRCWISKTSFVALLCTFSRATASFLKITYHTLEAYSRCGRTRDLYSGKKHFFI